MAKQPGKRKKDGAKADATEGLPPLNLHAAGIDVGSAEHYVAVSSDRDAEPVRKFGSFTADLHRMARWLKGCRIKTVVMQSTGVYWMALHDVLESYGLEVNVANARHTKTLPGRKTDVQECQWLMKLHTYGLLRDSFHLPSPMQGVRTVWRIRGRHVEEAARSIQHMQKALTKMNVQLANTISDLSGVTGQAIIGAILAGERDPHRLAELSDPHIQASREEIAHSLEGNWREDILFELQQAVDSYRFTHRQMQECDRKLQNYLAQLPSRTLENPGREAEKPPARNKKGRKSRKQGANAPTLDLHQQLQRICGVDLTSIDGINIISALTIVSEVGTDLSRFPDEDRFASWLGLTGNHPLSGGKRVKGAKRKVKSRVAAVLRMGAEGLLHSDSYLGARYRQLRRNVKTPQVAVKAMARQLAVLVYRLLTKGQAWVDRGAALFEQKRQQRQRTALEHSARAQGFQLVPLPAEN